MSQPPTPPARVWFARSLALTLALGATIALLLGLRPGYAALYWTSTIAFLLAGFLWTTGSPPRRHPARCWDEPRTTAPTMAAARIYRISALR
jgi:hypothetical protein